MTAARSRRAFRRPRPYDVLFNAHDTNTSNVRETIATPSKGKRVRILRVRVVQEYAEGRRFYEVYFGAGANIGSDASKAVDTLDIPSGGQGSTRVYLRDEGPRGERDEVLSGRWAGNAAHVAHQVVVEYTEES